MRAGYDDLRRPPLQAAALRRALLQPAGPLARLDVVPATTSTNDDLAQWARAGDAPDRTVLVAEHQQAGRGRLGRTWITPARAALTFSLLLRPSAGTEAGWSWLSLLAGVAVVRVLRAVCGVSAALKWPNDVLVPLGATPAHPIADADHKVAGILGEVVRPAGADPCVVLGIGLNTTISADELGLPGATSLVLAGAATHDRTVLLKALVRELVRLDEAWRAAGGDAQACGLAAEAQELCLTLGRRVRVSRPGADDLVGEAVGLDRQGRLLVQPDGSGGPVAVSAGDVRHVRPDTPSDDQ